MYTEFKKKKVFELLTLAAASPACQISQDTGSILASGNNYSREMSLHCSGC